MSILSQFKQSQNTDFPNVRPSLDLRFALAKKLDPRITFTRGTSGTYFGSDGLIKTAGVSEPRFDHDPITGQSLGLLIEESRSNLIVGSNDFGGGAAEYGITSGITSPDGTSNASLMYEKTNNGFHFLNLTPTFVVSTIYCASIFCKYAGSKYRFRLKFTDGLGVQNNIIIDLRNGSIISGSGVSNSYGVIKYSNGWYRVYTTLTATSASGFLQPFLLRDSDGSSTYQGDGSSGYYIYGAQVEAGSLPTSYIPTSGSAVTRSADLASMTGTNFSSWYNSSEGTLFAASRINALGGSGYPGIAYVDDGTANNCIGIVVMDASNDQIATEAYVSGANQYFLGSGSAIIPNQLSKTITTYQQNNFASAFSNMNNIQRDINCSIPIVNRLILGDLRGGNGKLNGTISRLTYYPIQLTNQQLINLVS